MAFDVFVSYHSIDRPFVKLLVAALAKEKLAVWFDEEQLPPGTRTRASLMDGIKQSATVLVCCGPKGFGEWQKEEIDAALNRRNRKECNVIPVLLPAVSAPPDELLGLEDTTWSKFEGASIDAEALRRLYWGITGRWPEATNGSETPKPVVPVPIRRTPLDDAVKDLGDVFRTSVTKTLTFFLGPTIFAPPTTSDLAGGLLQDLQVFGDGGTPLPLDYASSYYTAAKEGNELTLLETLFEVFRRSRNGSGDAAIHDKIAALFCVLERRPLPRTLNPPRPLIVSTNFDLMMERALLRAGVSFTRVVQHHKEPRIDVNEYHVKREAANVLFYTYEQVQEVNGGARTVFSTTPVDVGDTDGLNERIANANRTTVQFPAGERYETGTNPLRALSLRAFDVRASGDEEAARRSMLWPILYKCHGSEDLEGSYAVSADQYFQYVRETVLKGHIPQQLQTQIKDSSIVFLGYSFLDPAFRLIYNTLLFDRIRKPENKLFAIRPAPAAPADGAQPPIEFAIWDPLKNLASLVMGIKTIEADELDFVQRLTQQVAASLPAGGK